MVCPNFTKFYFYDYLFQVCHFHCLPFPETLELGSIPKKYVKGKKRKSKKRKGTKAESRIKKKVKSNPKIKLFPVEKTSRAGICTYYHLESHRPHIACVGLYIYIYVHTSFDIFTATSSPISPFLPRPHSKLLFFFIFFVCFISLFPTFLFFMYCALFISHHTLIFFILFFFSLIPTLTQFPAY